MGSRFDNLKSFATETLTVSVSGTPVQGTSSKVPDGVALIIMAHPDNTGRVTVAKTSALALNTADTGHPLDAGQAIALQLENVDEVWVDSTVSGDKVVLTTEKG